MRRLLVALAALAVACGEASPPAAVTPVTASPSGTPAAVAATTAPTPLLSCRLPVVKDKRGAWLDFATGSLTLDISVPTGDRLFYSRAAKKWFPVGRAEVSADGLEYAFVAPDGGGFGPGPMYVVNSASGAETQFTLPSAGVQAYWAVLDFSPPLVWLVTSYSTVSRLDLRTGTVTPTNISAPVWEVDKQVAWVGSVNPSDPNPQQGFAGSQSDQVDRVTLSGSRETWIYRASMALRVVGLDGHGSPIV